MKILSRKKPEKPEKSEKPEKPIAPPETKEKKPSVPGKRRRVLIRLGAGLALIAALAFGAFSAWTKLTDMSAFDITFYELNDEKIQGNVRIAFLSDLHLQEFGKDNADLVAAIRRLAPDLIAIGGDMNISGNPDYQAVLTLVAQLTPIAPTYYALGNHEYEDYLFADSPLLSDVKKLGVTVLSNRYVTISVNDNLIDLGGLNEMSNHFAEYSQKFYESYLESEHYRLLLAHDPAYFGEKGALVGEPIDLALCGHRHGGQIILPYVGGLYYPGVGLLPDMTSGAHDVDGTWVVVSRGLGNGSGFPRVNNPPELVIIDLY